MDDRKAMTAIFYITRTGCQWKALPQRSLGASSTGTRQVSAMEKRWYIQTNVD